MSSSLTRRLLLKLLGVGSAATLAGCGDDSTDSETGNVTDGSFEYIVVGSGAGGGPLAANLARAGHRVLLLEAGTDRGSSINYQVPAFHPLATEDASMRWDYFVRHYANETQQQRDTKMTDRGVLYPRAGTLGGCTAHNAMITVYPHARDWDRIADLTGDESWRSTKMRHYFEVLEKCEYMPGKDHPKGHGFKGWLKTHLADAEIGLRDSKLARIIAAAAIAFGIDGFKIGAFLSGTPFHSQLLTLLKKDLNNADAGRDQAEGLFTIPMATDGQHRNGPREYILSTIAAGFPLTLRTNALVSRIVFKKPIKGKKLVARGVEYLDGEHLYRADPAASSQAGGKKRIVEAKREVILAAGAFNTPQLLKLSGIGPKDELEELGIDVMVELPGVGTNLQDRYEVGVVSEMASDLSALDGCTWGKSGDPCMKTWQDGGGVYTSNGGVVGIVKRSSAAQPDPDLFIFGLPGYFKGYEPGYSKKITADKKHFTWAVLKAHTGNTAGTVTLRTIDPRDTPDINFRYFSEGSKDAGQDTLDLKAVVEGFKFARKIGGVADDLMLFGKFQEIVPGSSVKTDADITKFVKDEAWGHHASCTCKIGAEDDPMAVLDSRFRVRGTEGLRVVDASVFPKIPGFFIVVPIYMVSEKATDVLLEDIGETRGA